jgi:hypothetical protein
MEMREGSMSNDTPYDECSARIRQARAAIIAMTHTYQDNGQFKMPANWMYEGLTAVNELLDQAESAFKKIELASRRA